MAKKAQPPVTEPPQGEFIVNPAGVVHEVSAAHAAERIAQDPRYRRATAEEVAAYEAAHGYQSHERPLGRQYSVDSHQ